MENRSVQKLLTLGTENLFGLNTIIILKYLPSLTNLQLGRLTAEQWLIFLQLKIERWAKYPLATLC